MRRWRRYRTRACGIRCDRTRTCRGGCPRARASGAGGASPAGRRGHLAGYRLRCLGDAASCPLVLFVGQLPASVHRVGRHKDHTTLSDDPTKVCGYDTGTSAINLAYHFGVSEVILLGYDMTGGRWFTGEIPHPMPVIPESHFQGHMAPLPQLAEDCRKKGLRVINCSPISRVTCFERQPLEALL